jgi:hypothetical protein
LRETCYAAFAIHFNADIDGTFGADELTAANAHAYGLILPVDIALHLNHLSHYFTMHVHCTMIRLLVQADDFRWCFKKYDGAKRGGMMYNGRMNLIVPNAAGRA